MKSRRVDVLEINYEACIGGKDGPVYYSSAERGTGKPYMFVLGSIGSEKIRVGRRLRREVEEGGRSGDQLRGPYRGEGWAGLQFER